jgi:translation elongation factor EF-1beta
LAKVLVSLKIFPSDVDVDRESLKEPIAFGLVAIIAHVLLPEDKAGGIDEVESNLKKIAEISDFQTLTVRRV